MSMDDIWYGEHVMYGHCNSDLYDCGQLYQWAELDLRADRKDWTSADGYFSLYMDYYGKGQSTPSRFREHNPWDEATEERRGL